mmetsp:Transcript_424/g.825  ORF Transcript_424/g.825 Transcript_424/m.825 type:complete len:221 (-) Transcript_424:1390-2052(-)
MGPAQSLPFNSSSSSDWSTTWERSCSSCSSGWVSIGVPTSGTSSCASCSPHPGSAADSGSSNGGASELHAVEETSTTSSVMSDISDWLSKSRAKLLMSMSPLASPFSNACPKFISSLQRSSSRGSAAPLPGLATFLRFGLGGGGGAASSSAAAGSAADAADAAAAWAVTSGAAAGAAAAGVCPSSSSSSSAAAGLGGDDDEEEDDVEDRAGEEEDAGVPA